MSIGPEGVKKLVETGIDAQLAMRENVQELAILLIEFGYAACEEGKTLEQAILEYKKIKR